MILTGFPTATRFGGAFFVTTAPTPTTEFFPTVTPGGSLAPVTTRLRSSPWTMPA